MNPFKCLIQTLPVIEARHFHDLTHSVIAREEKKPCFLYTPMSLKPNSILRLGIWRQTTGSLLEQF